MERKIGTEEVTRLLNIPISILMRYSTIYPYRSIRIQSIATPPASWSADVHNPANRKPISAYLRMGKAPAAALHAPPKQLRLPRCWHWKSMETKWINLSFADLAHVGSIWLRGECSCVCGWVERTFLVDVWRYDYDGSGLRKRALRVCLSHCSLLIYQSSSADPLLLLLTHRLTPTINNNYVCDMSQTHSGVLFHYRAYLFESHLPIYARLYL